LDLEGDKMSDHNTVNGRRLEIENSLEKISEEVFQRFNEVCRLTHFHILAFNEVRLQICMIFKTEKTKVSGTVLLYFGAALGAESAF